MKKFMFIVYYFIFFISTINYYNNNIYSHFIPGAILVRNSKNNFGAACKLRVTVTDLGHRPFMMIQSFN